MFYLRIKLICVWFKNKSFVSFRLLVSVATPDPTPNHGTTIVHPNIFFLTFLDTQTDVIGS